MLAVRRRIPGIRPRIALIVAVVSCISATPTTALQQKRPVYDGETRLRFYEQHEAMKEASRFKEVEWVFLGPEVMSGRVTDIAVPPGSRWTIYVATASGGVWRTINEGTTWEPIFDNAPSGSTGAIAIPASDPELVWVGLGEANIFRSSMSGTGVYKSSDGGKSWQHMGLADTHHIARIVIHPTDPDTVYVAASGKEWTDNPERGVFKTTDGGNTWEKVLYVNERTGAIDLRIDPSDPETLYAAMWDRIRLKWMDPKPGPGSGIYKTNDGGRTWREIRNGLPESKELTGRIGIDVSRSNPNVLYALIDNHEPAREPEEGELDSYGRLRQTVIKGAQVYRSNDKGETWMKVSESSPEMERLFSTYGWVFGQIRVDPSDADTTYIMGVPMLKSIDGGREYVVVRYEGLHGDHHAMWIDPEDANHIINGNDGGVNIAYDGARTWRNLENHGVVQFYNVAYDMQEPFNVYGSIQDNSSWMGGPVTLPSEEEEEEQREPFRREWRRPQWRGTLGGEASYHAIDPTDPSVIFSESFYGQIQRTLEGETESITPPVGEDESPLRGQWLAPFLMSPHNPQVIYHGMQYIFRTMNRGETWERISPDLTYNDPGKQGDISYQTITAISESPLKFGLLYVGTDDGRAWVTRDGGSSWSEMTDGTTALVPGKWVSRAAASAFDEGTAYLSQNGKRDNDFQVYLYKTTDYGESWVDISDGIPGGPINVVKEDPKDPNILYVGTDLGVYVSTDGGGSWDVLANGIPNTFVHDLIVHPRDDIMVVATHGRGMYALDASKIREVASLFREVDDETVAGAHQVVGRDQDLLAPLTGADAENFL